MSPDRRPTQAPRLFSAPRLVSQLFRLAAGLHLALGARASSGRPGAVTSHLAPWLLEWASQEKCCWPSRRSCPAFLFGRDGRRCPGRTTRWTQGPSELLSSCLHRWSCCLAHVLVSHDWMKLLKSNPQSPSSPVMHNCRVSDGTPLLVSPVAMLAVGQQDVVCVCVCVCVWRAGLHFCSSPCLSVALNVDPPPMSSVPPTAVLVVRKPQTCRLYHPPAVTHREVSFNSVRWAAHCCAVSHDGCCVCPHHCCGAAPCSDLTVEEECAQKTEQGQIIRKTLAHVWKRKNGLNLVKIVDTFGVSSEEALC